MSLGIELEFQDGEGGLADGVAHAAQVRRRVVENLSFQLDALVKEMAEAYTACAGEGREFVAIDGLLASAAATEQLLLASSLPTSGPCGGG